MKKNSQEHYLSLIIPAYKEEEKIVSTVREIKSALDQIRYDYEIIVVIDGDVDDSLKKLRAAKLGKSTCVVYKENQGKAFAVRLGMKLAKGDYVMFMDAGSEIHPNGISMLIEHMEWYNADIIVGSKRHAASMVRYSPIRKILSLGYFMGVRVLFNLSITDTQAGIKIFKKKVLEKILPRLLEKKFAGDLEMLVVARNFGFNRIYEAPIKMDYALGSITSAASLKAITRMAIDTLAIFYRARILGYYKQKGSIQRLSPSFIYKTYRI